jgi:hypothetical protein
MSIDIGVLVETYQVLTQYVPSKDRQEAADALTSTLVDLVNDQDLAEIADADRYMRNSYSTYVEPDDDRDLD